MVISEQYLISISRDIDEIAGRFVHEYEAVYFASGDEARFKRLVLEAIAELDEFLGATNPFSLNLQRLMTKGSGLSSSPSLRSVEEASEIVSGGANRIKLKALRNSGGQIPASNRYVALTDNQKTEVEDDLSKLAKAVSGTNEAGEEERMIALSEIAAFEQTIIQQRVSTDLIQRFVDTILKWITITFSRAAVAEVAQRLMQALIKLISPA